MSENDIRAAFEQIELPDGAQERMYQNILKNAAAPKKARNPSAALCRAGSLSGTGLYSGILRAARREKHTGSGRPLQI